MDFQQLLMTLPGLQPDELVVIQEITRDMTETQKQQFIMFYKGKRKQQQELLILTLIGFFGVAGIQRFVLGEIGMGILYLLTIGFCGIGTIIDIVNHRSMTAQYNQKEAIESAGMVKMISK